MLKIKRQFKKSSRKHDVKLLIKKTTLNLGMNERTHHTHTHTKSTGRIHLEGFGVLMEITFPTQIQLLSPQTDSSSRCVNMITKYKHYNYTHTRAHTHVRAMSRMVAVLAGQLSLMSNCSDFGFSSPVSQYKPAHRR